MERKQRAIQVERSVRKVSALPYPLLDGINQGVQECLLHRTQGVKSRQGKELVLNKK